MCILRAHLATLQSRYTPSLLRTLPSTVQYSTVQYSTVKYSEI